MRKINISVFILVSALVGMSFVAPKAPSAFNKESVILSAVIKFLNQIHFRPKQLNDDLSKQIFDIYLERLDGGKRYFTKKDFEVLGFYSDKIDDEIQKNSFAFFDLSINLLDRGIEKTQKYYKDILAEPFDFKIQEDFESNYEKRPYVENDDELFEVWRMSLKYETLTRVKDKLDAQNKEDFEGVKLSKDSLEFYAREDVKEVYDQYFGRMEQLRRADRFADYVNSITHLYDPHSDYFSPKEKADFDINMSGRLEGIGARLSIEKNMTKVSSIVAGGPAWKQGELEVDYYITEVAQQDEDPVGIVGWRLDDVVQLIRGKKGTWVTLTVKKVDGTIGHISIERDEVITSEGNAKSAIVKKENSESSYGYLYLPRFYADFERKDGRSCAKDVKIELEKLKAENVDGIVLDLRNNGGGSLRDVVEMSGLFIEEGPIVQVKSRNQRAKVLKDTEGNVIYDGPLVVLVNHYSASASEILAAALQDYNRAVIVGSETFGKGTVQRFYDLDRAVQGNGDDPLGEVKMTTQKFYRINGGSTQLKGVTPDVLLPDNYNYIKTGEKRYDFPMEWTEIEPVPYEQNAYQIKNLSEVQLKSQERISQVEDFKLIEEYSQYLKKQEDSSIIPLSFDAYSSLEDGLNKSSEKFKNIMKEPIEGLMANNLAVDFSEIEVDEGKKARNDEWLANIQKDIYINESLSIIEDLKEAN